MIFLKIKKYLRAGIEHSPSRPSIWKNIIDFFKLYSFHTYLSVVFLCISRFFTLFNIIIFMSLTTISITWLIKYINDTFCYFLDYLSPRNYPKTTLNTPPHTSHPHFLTSQGQKIKVCIALVDIIISRKHLPLHWINGVIMMKT